MKSSNGESDLKSLISWALGEREHDVFELQRRDGLGIMGHLR